MIARAPLADVSSVAREDVTLRRTAASDRPFCRALFHEERAAQFAPLGLDAGTLTALLDQQFHAQQVGYQSAYPHADDRIAMQDGAAIGRVMFDRQDGDVVYIIDIVVLSAVRGRGIGSAVIAALEQAARTDGAKWLSLSVLSRNADARRLYERLGFRAVADLGLHIKMTKSIGG